MTATYEKIATTTVSGTSTSQITFSSITGTYTDLVMIMNARTNSNNNNYFLLTVNGDTGSNYSRTGMYGNGSIAGSFRNSNISGTYVTIGELDQNYGNAILNFQNYSNTTTYKTILQRENWVDSTTYAVVSLWRSTSAINSITVAGDGYNIGSGSTFTLYGIKAE
jgi:hypothetical protein